jgi:membrane-bound ClpP family serine protease
VLAAVVSALSAGLLWWASHKVMAALRKRPLQDLGALVGLLGETKTRVHDQGSVQVNGELWSARSEKPIPAGSHVRVLSRDGFVLVVEIADQPNA